MIILFLALLQSDDATITAVPLLQLGLASVIIYGWFVLISKTPPKFTDVIVIILMFVHVLDMYKKRSKVNVSSIQIVLTVFAIILTLYAVTITEVVGNR